MASEELKNLLKSSAGGDLGTVVRRAKAMGELTAVISRALPADYTGAVVAANVRENGELVVIAASSAWASRLRYETERLEAAARDAGLKPTACRVRVARQ